MNNILKALAIAALFCCGQTGMAQEKKFIAGGRMGLGFSTLPQLHEDKSLVHFAFGGSSTYHFFPFLGLSADALFITSGGAYSGSKSIEVDSAIFSSEPYDGDIRFTSLSIPLYPQLNLGNEDFRVILSGGIVTNFNLFAHESRDYEDDNGNDNIKDQVKEILEDYKVVTFSVMYGAGTRFKISKDEYLQADIRTTFGLSDLYTTEDNEDPVTIRRNLFTVSVTYYF